MKKISIAILLFLTAIGATYANGHGTMPGNHGTMPGDHKIIPGFKGEENFMETFPGATEVRYNKVTGQITEVNFTWKALKLSAFYDADGNHIATSRRITFANLPLKPQMALNEKYAGYITTDVQEYNDVAEGLCYYVTVANVKKTYVLQVSANGSISIFKKIKN